MADYLYFDVGVKVFVIPFHRARVRSCFCGDIGDIGKTRHLPANRAHQRPEGDGVPVPGVVAMVVLLGDRVATGFVGQDPHASQAEAMATLEYTPLKLTVKMVSKWIIWHF